MSAGAIAGDRYVVISADGHAGGDIQDYKPYLARRYHDDFDRWAADFVNPFGDLQGETAYRNWDSKRRLAELESDGVVAEVLFPNTVPPFFPSSNLTAQPPGAGEDYERRWEGLKAHNRWMVDFCADASGRRAGMVQVLLHDVKAAIAEIEWGKEAGLSGVLLPGIPPDSGLPPFIAPDYEPLWAACEALEMPISHHTGNATPAYEGYKAGMAMFLVEQGFFSHRPLWMLIFSGVFERHPDLKFVFTEGGADWIPGVMDVLEYQYSKFQTPGKPEYFIGGSVLEEAPRPPREYFEQNVWVGASFMLPTETAIRQRIGVGKLMWGQDYPHIEGTYPYTREALRRAYAGVPTDEVAAMVGGNAAHVYGFDLDLLSRVAADVGPTVAEVDVPLDEKPADTFSKAFEDQVQRTW